MHFDEVYHARTATEFLQDWRYGMPHDIYEYTHPHLAKYAMAVGLIVAGDDRVTAQRELGTAVRDALVEPRWDDPTLPDARAGDRVLRRQRRPGPRLRPRDRGAWSRRGRSPGSRRSPSTRRPSPRSSGPIPGRSSRSTRARRSTASGRRGSTSVDDAGPGPAELASVGAPITRIALTDDGTGMAVATADGDVVLVDPGTGSELARTRFERGRGPGRRRHRQRADRGPGRRARPGRRGGRAGGRSPGATRRSTSAGSPPRPATARRSSSWPPSRTSEEATLQAAIADGRLDGLRDRRPCRAIAVAEAGGVTFVVAGDRRDRRHRSPLDAPARGLAKVTGIDKPTLYVALGDERMAVVLVGEGDGKTRRHARQDVLDARRRPGVVFDPSTSMVHVLGRHAGRLGRHDLRRRAARQRGLRRRAAPVRRRRPGRSTPTRSTRATTARRSCVTSAGGTLATVDIGQPRVRLAPPGRHRRRRSRRASSSSSPGSCSGAATVAVLAAILVLADGMLFVQSPDRDERRLRRLLHRRRVHPVRARSGPGAGGARGRSGSSCPLVGRPARARPRLEVGRPLRDGRDRRPHPRPLGARADAPHPRADRRDHGPRLHGDRRPARTRRRAPRNLTSSSGS